MSGTCSVRTENAGTSMSTSRSKAFRAATLVSGRLISEVGRSGAISTAVFIVQRFLLQFLESLTFTARGARATSPACLIWLSGGDDPGLGPKPGTHRRVGEIDGLQAFLGVAAAAVGIGMVPLRQFLVAAFDRIQRGRP